MSEYLQGILTKHHTLCFLRTLMADAITVQLAERSYTIYFGEDLSGQIVDHVQQLQNKGRKVALITDEHVARAQANLLDALGSVVPKLVVTPGEKAKSILGLEQCLDFLSQNKLDRGGVVIALGGGVIGDLVGFAAASYLRGISFIQIPTTLLAMVDSSVGGKTGINLKSGKNLAGAFHQPSAVYISTDCLSTLPSREFAAGMAEVIKYGLLSDKVLFEQLETSPITPTSSQLTQVIKRCCQSKASIVEKDEKELAEQGGRALLNLGHTFAHAIENVSGYGTYLHGEAVAIGLCAAARLSHKLGYLGLDDISRVERVVKAHGLPTALSQPLALSDLMQATTRDKKNKAGSLRFIVLKQLGSAEVHSQVDLGLAEASFKEIGAR